LRTDSANRGSAMSFVTLAMIALSLAEGTVAFFIIHHFDTNRQPDTVFDGSKSVEQSSSKLGPIVTGPLELVTRSSEVGQL
jgi:hypothetical protein